MVPLTSLWAPILLSAVIVFVASAIFQFLLPVHRKDYVKVPREAEVMDALRPFALTPGDYVMPLAEHPQRMDSPEMLEKMNRGPVVMMTVMPSGPPAMGSTFAQWFAYCLVVSLFAGYIASRALGPGARYLDVHQIAGTVAFVGYALALWQMSIWFKRDWGTTMRSTVDGLVYGLLTGGVFGWLWTR